MHPHDNSTTNAMRPPKPRRRAAQRAHVKYSHVPTTWFAVLIHEDGSRSARPRAIGERPCDNSTTNAMRPPKPRRQAAHRAHVKYSHVPATSASLYRKRLVDQRVLARSGCIPRQLNHECDETAQTSPSSCAADTCEMFTCAHDLVRRPYTGRG